MDMIHERLATLEAEMIDVKKGVSNFRDFQVEGREFFTRSDQNAKDEAKFALQVAQKQSNRMNLFGIAIAALTLVLGIHTYIESRATSPVNTPNTAITVPLAHNGGHQ